MLTVQVRPATCNKAVCLRSILQHCSGADFVLCAGDDRTDEDMFRLLCGAGLEQQPATVVTCIVGYAQRSAARYCCRNADALLSVLDRLARE